MVVSLKIIAVSLEYYATVIISNVDRSFCHFLNVRCTSRLNQCIPQTRNAARYTARWMQVIHGALCKIGFLPEQWLCQSFVYPTTLPWPICGAIIIYACSISQLVIIQKISTGHLNSMRGCSFGWSPIPRNLPEILTTQAIPESELRCPLSGILTYPLLARNGIVLIDSRDNLIHLWLPGSGNIWTKS